MKIRIWNLQRREYEMAEVISVSYQNIMVRVDDRTFPIQLNDVDPDYRKQVKAEQESEAQKAQAER
jgi:hypothetical protein